MFEELSIESTAYLSNKDLYFCKDESFLLTPFYTSIKVDFSHELSEEELESDLDKTVEVGHISHHQFNLDYSQNDLAMIADGKSSDLCYAASFFFYEQGKENLSFRHLFYINQVFIEPKYRGRKYGIKALAMLLQHYAWGETVCCHPSPFADLKDKYSEEKGKLLMRKYWSKVGLHKYSAKHNILWTDEWSMPDWLRTQLFADEGYVTGAIACE